MSYLAYLDNEKTNTIKANDAFLCFGKNNREYYCQNLVCTAKMTLKSRKGESAPGDVRNNGCEPRPRRH